MEQANRQPKQNRTAHTKRTAGSGSAGQTNRRKSLRKGGRKAARRSGTKRRNTAEKGKIPPWASREKAAKNLCPLHKADKQDRQCQRIPRAHAALAEKTPGHRAQKPTQQRLAAQEQPARHIARHAGQKEPLRTGKMRVRSFACPEGLCEPGPPKTRFAVFGWHGLFLLRIAHNAAQNAE